MRLLLGLLLAGPAGALELDCLAQGADCRLREAAEQAGVWVGAAVAPAHLDDDPLYGPLLALEFDSLTAENAMKWPQLHPEREVYRFEDADRVVEFAEQHAMRVRGHTLLWANPLRLPGYVNAASSEQEARALLTEHIESVVGRYRGRVQAWDVVNEPLENLGSVLFDNVFLQQIGPGYIAEAFRIAHEADPDALLFLNEIYVSAPGSERFEVFFQLVKGMVDDGVPIHGVGLQTHLIGGVIQPSAADFEAAVRTFAELGLVVEITEMDVAMFSADLEHQGEIYREITGACLAVEACQALTFWGFTDRYSWLDAAFRPGLVPLPLDQDYGRKPAYFAVRDSLLERIAVPEPGIAGQLVAVLLAIALQARSRRASDPARRGPSA